MLKVKNLWKIALVLIGIGVIGSVFTFTSSGEKRASEEVEFDSDNIEKIDIRSDNAKVEVLPTEQSSLKVKVFAEGRYDRLLSEVKGDALSIQVKDKKDRFINFNFFDAGTSLKVYMPKKQYDSLDIKSHNGTVSLNNFHVDQAKVEADNGKIELQDINARMIDAETNNGKIDFQHVMAATIEAETDNGHMVFDQVEGNLVGRTNNGRVSIKTENIDRLIDLKTDNGRIDIQTDEEPTNVVLDIKTKNGKVTVFGESDWDTVIGNGDHLVKLRTANGRVTIEK